MVEEPLPSEEGAMGLEEDFKMRSGRIQKPVIVNIYYSLIVQNTSHTLSQ